MTSEYEMRMPFITVTSKGGPHDDDSYVAGWEMGALDRDLRMAALIQAEVTVTMHSENTGQADLIALSHGYVMRAIGHDAGVPEWAEVTFGPAREEEEDDDEALDTDG